MAALSASRPVKTGPGSHEAWTTSIALSAFLPNGMHRTATGCARNRLTSGQKPPHNKPGDFARRRIAKHLDAPVQDGEPDDAA